MYRVLELPDSMKALIYDFGRLSYKTEREYIVQMAHNKVELTEFVIIFIAIYSFITRLVFLQLLLQMYCQNVKIFPSK